jgi:hypothetical protein
LRGRRKAEGGRWKDEGWCPWGGLGEERGKEERKEGEWKVESGRVEGMEIGD